MTHQYSCGCVVDCPAFINRNLIVKCEKHKDCRIYPLSDIFPKIEVSKLVLRI